MVSDICSPPPPSQAGREGLTTSSIFIFPFITWTVEWSRSCPWVSAQHHSYPVRARPPFLQFQDI